MQDKINPWQEGAVSSMEFLSKDIKTFFDKIYSNKFHDFYLALSINDDNKIMHVALCDYLSKRGIAMPM